MSSEKVRIIQEMVPGKQITLAHIISKPKPVLYQKLGLNPEIDYKQSSIGILTMIPSEMAIIASDLATKASDIVLEFVDRFSGTLIITGSISNVETAVREITNYAKETLEFAICDISKS